MLTIYDSNGNRRTDIEAGDSSTQVKEVQGDNVLTLSFTHYEYIALDVNDRVDFEGERYWLTERYIPKQKSGQEWVYDLKFYGIESLVRRFLVLETTDGNTEPVFTLTATPREHVAMIVKCINDGMNHTTDWKVGRVDGTDLIVIDYEGKYCNEALKEIAEAVGGQAEWWVEGQTVNVCRCEHGEEITLGYGKGLTGIERDTTGTDNFYTRLFPVGSTRNIDPSKYGHSRLMLPGGRQYVEIHTEEYGIYDRYEQDAFSGIYPRRIGAVSSVRSEDVKDDDGNPFTVYYFRDDSLNFDPNDYELPDETKRVSFQDGDLSGLGQGEDHYFEVNFNSATREFEIITIWPYDDDTQLPGGKLIPKSGDRYILWNIRMPDEYYPLAEEEFLTAVEQFNTECWQDLAVYKAPTDHVWIEENGVSLSVGRRVRLESEEYFPETGYRSSRITKITRKVNQPGEMDIEISDALHSGAFERVNDSIGELKNYTKSKAEGAALPDIIRSWDKTLPTDNNLFSARRSQAEHISKKKNDRAKGKITFEAGASFGQEDNAGIDDKGNAELLTLVVREFLRSPKFVDGLFGEGWRLWMEDALSHLTIDKLTVRQVMVVLEMLIEKVRSVGGQLCVSAANGKIKTAVLEGGYWRITFEQENTFVAHDLMRIFEGKTYEGVEFAGTNYWMLASMDGDSLYQDYDGYTLFPDGSGTLIRFEDLDSSLTMSGKLYGEDYAYQDAAFTYSQTVRMPVYGLVSNYYSEETKTEIIDGNVEFNIVRTDTDRGFLAIVEEGESLASITSEHGANSIHKFNSAYTTFSPRPKDTYSLADAISVSSDTTWTVVSKRKYTGSYTIRVIQLNDAKDEANCKTTKFYESTFSESFAPVLVTRTNGRWMT